MESRIRNRIIFATLVVFVAGLLPASAQTLVHHYELNNSLADTLSGPALLDDGGVLEVGGGYSFGGNQGLRLVGPGIGSGHYAIELTFSLVSANPLNSFHKIVDYDEGNQDSGFYVSTGGTASFAELFGTIHSGSAGAFQDGVLATVLVTRDSSSEEVKVFVDTVEQLSFFDTSFDSAVIGSGNTLAFFEDDIFGPETGSGFVRNIKIYDAPFVPMPPMAAPPITSNVTPDPNPASVNEMVL
ncbi:MAG: hypothetical protein O2968_23740 [Acidobacteria bacterium]|nr:hypothetical protein [Acidobacteriota bacterium]